MNKKGFMLLETLIVSTFILGVLIFLYIQFSSLKRSYDDSFTYNTIPGLYHARTFSDYLLESDLVNIGTKDYLVFNCSINSNDNVCINLKEAINADIIIVTKRDIGILQSDVKLNKLSNISESFKKYILSLEQSVDCANSRIIILYKDNTFASLVIDGVNKYGILASDIAYTTPLNKKVTNAQEAVVDLYKKYKK